MSDTRITENGDKARVLDHEVILTSFSYGRYGIETDTGYIELSADQVNLVAREVARDNNQSQEEVADLVWQIVNGQAGWRTSLSQLERIATRA